MSPPILHGTTILAVRREGRTAIAGDGQVTLGQTVVKQGAMQANAATENIGARRLATILETVLEDVSFEAGERTRGALSIDADYVRRKLALLAQDQDLSRFIL